MVQNVEFKWFADKKIPRLMVSYVIGNWISQWRNDLSVWVCCGCLGDVQSHLSPHIYNTHRYV